MFLFLVVMFLCFAAFNWFWDRLRSRDWHYDWDWDWNGLFNLYNCLITDDIQVSFGIDHALRKLTADSPCFKLPNPLPVAFQLLQRDLPLPFTLLVPPLTNKSSALRLTLSCSPATELFSKLRFDLSFLDSPCLSLLFSNRVLHLS